MIIQILLIIYVIKISYFRNPIKTTTTMQTRLNVFKSTMDGLTVSDVQNAVNFPFWCQSWAYYVMGIGTGDRPPIKPPHA